MALIPGLYKQGIWISLSLRTAWSTKRFSSQPKLHSETLSRRRGGGGGWGEDDDIGRLVR